MVGEDVEVIEDADALIVKVQSMNTSVLESFVKKEELNVNLEGKNLPEKREAVIAALKGEVEEDDL